VLCQSDFYQCGDGISCGTTTEDETTDNTDSDDSGESVPPAKRKKTKAKV